MRGGRTLTSIHSCYWTKSRGAFRYINMSTTWTWHRRQLVLTCIIIFCIWWENGELTADRPLLYTCTSSTCIHVLFISRKCVYPTQSRSISDIDAISSSWSNNFLFPVNLNLCSSICFLNTSAFKWIKHQKSLNQVNSRPNLTITHQASKNLWDENQHERRENLILKHIRSRISSCPSFYLFKFDQLPQVFNLKNDTLT